MDMKYFPFDKHQCSIKFIESIRFGTHINGGNQQMAGVAYNKRYTGLQRQFYVANEEWDLVSGTINNDSFEIKYPSVNVIYPRFEVLLELQRKPSFYAMVLMLPMVLVASISVIGFLLPSESGEKVSLQLTALLSYMLLLLVVVDIIPPIGGNFPVIGNVFYHIVV